MKYVNAEGCVLGRIASYVSKQALMGEQVIVVNAEKALISGERKTLERERKETLEIKNLGNYTKGPFHQKRPDRFVRKVIRGMLPYKKSRGREAFKRVNVYMGVPEDEIKRRTNIDVSKMKPESLDHASKNLRRSITVGQLCSSIGGR
ncbi:50S ribosomal protein L13 [Candidatus Altiarchaeota archaeon]